MLTHPVDTGHTLFEVGDLEQDPPEPAVRPWLEPLRTVVTWAREYLCHPHPQLGRAGNVCPYAAVSLDRSAFYLAVCPGRTHPPASLERRLLVYRDWFPGLSRQHGADARLTTILLALPDLRDEDLPEVVDATQARLKSQYVRHGLMLGEFHAGPPAKPGLWNESFRPLRCPVPLLVIRHMVPTDFMFLRDDPEHLRAYLDRFGHQVPTGLHAAVRTAARRFGLPLPGAGDRPPRPAIPPVDHVPALDTAGGTGGH
ncbi:DUF6875 domain-containing protein [Micromonospora echinofusca]|uniref:DUF6875 domain-containing protein n=1 Tax=Micromonospora echinofusca TaxID=47858 RepID=UPI001FCAD979|nr:hypothetical protein [Micromonospora echinofusca]